MKSTITYTDALSAAIACPSLSDEVREKLSALKVQTEKRNASKSTKPTKTQVANVGIKDAILDFLANGNKFTITEMQEQVADLGALSNQKVSSLVRQLIDEGKVCKEVIKRKAYFFLAD